MTKLIDQYLADSPSLMAALKNAVERRDAPALRLATHSLKGTSSAVGANRMAAICEELEKLGRNTTFDGTPVSPVLSRADCVFGDGCLIVGQPLGVQSGRIRSFAGTPVLDRALVDVLIS